MNVFKPVNAPAATRRSGHKAAVLMAARVWHAYAGAFFAPAILFFSVTGAFQTFNLHKPSPGYHPPAALQALASMHKNQNLTVKYVDRAGRKAGGGGNADDHDRQAPPPLAGMIAQQILKVFAALASVGLTATTVLGLYMSWQTTRRRPVLLWFAAGLALPMLLMLAI